MRKCVDKENDKPSQKNKLKLKGVVIIKFSTMITLERFYLMFELSYNIEIYIWEE